MKVYVISDSLELGIAASNMVNQQGDAGILSELKDADLKDLLDDVKQNVNSAYDIVLVLWSGASAAAISANKLAGVRAVVVKDREDATDAVSEAHANAVFVNSSKLDKRTLSSIVNGMLSAAPDEEAQAGAKSPKQAPQRKEAVEPSKPSMLDALKERAASITSRPGDMAADRPRQKQRTQASDEEGEGLLETIKSKGLKKAIKETFGLEDEDE